MFDLEQSIADWRRQMLAAGIKTPVPLEELESHLREEIERQMKLGLNEQNAFKNASQRIGQPNVLNSEFQKIGQANLLKNEFQKANPLTVEKIMSVGVGIPTVFVGLSQAWELVAQSRGLGKLPNEEARLIAMFVLAFILAITLVVSGTILIFHGSGMISMASKRKA
jgi:hypothetical protein